MAAYLGFLFYCLHFWFCFGSLFLLLFFLPHRCTSSHFRSFILFVCKRSREKKTQKKGEKIMCSFYYHIEKSLNLLSSSHCVNVFCLVLTHCSAMTFFHHFISLHLYSKFIAPEWKRMTVWSDNGFHSILILDVFNIAYLAENKIKCSSFSTKTSIFMPIISYYTLNFLLYFLLFFF